MSAYFNHEYASNSDLKRLITMIEHGDDGKSESLEAIFDLGTLNHYALLEPHKAEKWLMDKIAGIDPLSMNPEAERDKYIADYGLAVQMAKTVMKDDMCRNIIMASDFRREHEFYKKDVYGIPGRCKMDGSSKKMGVIFEYKGLSVTTEKAFEEAIDRFHYDQGAAWYLNCSDYKFHQYRYWLIAAVSKKDPDRLFKRIVDRNHQIYIRGDAKCIKSTSVWKNMLL